MNKKTFSPPGFAELLRNPRRLLRPALIAAVYFFAFIILDLFSQQFEELRGVVAWYPPAGLTYTLLLVFGVGFAPAVTFALFISSIFIYRMPQPAYLLFLWAVIISLIYVATAAFLHSRIHFDWQLRKLRDVAWLVGTTVFVSALLAVLSVSSSALSSNMQGSEVLRSIFLWWIGETVGVLTVTPFLLIHVMPWLKRFAEGVPVRLSGRRSFPRLTLSVIGQALSIAFMFYWVFSGSILNEFRPLYLISLPLIWIALDHGFMGITTGILLLNFGVALTMLFFRFDFAHLGELQLLMIVNCIVGLLMGAVVTERRKAEAALRDGEERYRLLVETLPDGVVVHSEGRIVFANPASAAIMGAASPADLIGMPVLEFVHPDYREIALKRIQLSQSEGSPIPLLEEVFVRQDGTLIDVELSGSPFSYAGKPATLSVFYEITERKIAEQEIASLAKFPSENPNPVLRLSREGIVMYANTASSALLDLWGCAVGGKVPQFWRDQVAQSLLIMENMNLEIECDGKIYSIFITPVAAPGYVNLYGRDITERKQAEEILRNSREELYRLLNSMAEGAYGIDIDGNCTFVNRAFLHMLGYPNEQEVLGKQIHELIHHSHKDGSPYPSSECRMYRTRKTNQSINVADEVFWHKDGIAIPVEYWSHPIVRDGVVIGSIATFIDISDRTRAEERIRRQLEHLTALSTIDRVISSNFDLSLNLSEILTHVTKELGVDAADILIFNPNSLMLENGADLGFHNFGSRKKPIRLGESYAGRAALERQLVQIPNLTEDPDNLLLAPPLRNEEFVCYYGLPLIAKGQVKGVLEVFNRTALQPDPEWIDFLNTLAGQAAIAIENATLFESLQHSNLELTLAYDATIEGWSRALDLRDKETEGHTRRVTEMTVKLARAIGLSEAELVQIRWGALLHDIGKMGVPDRILLKPEPLTAKEWVAMKKHPTLAYEMLSPIRYLHLALDIPYYHHEKWDGTGYPQGLAGTQIPLAARIFAVVDVWDALNSDRPYRKAWPMEKIHEHIRASTGTHFDPQVVDVFMQIPH